MTTIAGTTVLAGIIGWPVTHSLSPAMHNAAFAALGLDMAYVPLPVAPDSTLKTAVKGLRGLGFRGANVTMPHKRAVAPFLDRVADDARLIAAVNTIVVDGGVLVGYNTDVGGFVAALQETVSEPLAGASALVLGAGGARARLRARPAAGRRASLYGRQPYGESRREARRPAAARRRGRAFPARGARCVPTAAQAAPGGHRGQRDRPRHGRLA